MRNEHTFVELCAGTAAVSLWLLGEIGPLTAFMGSKRRWRQDIVTHMRISQPDRVVLVDAGPWGDVWCNLTQPAIRERVVALLTQWQHIVAVMPDPQPKAVVRVWQVLAQHQPADDPATRTAQYLWMQAYAVGGVPVWWDGRWSRPHSSGRQANYVTPAKPVGTRRLYLHPTRLCDRISALDRIDWSRIDVLHADVRSVEPIPGAVVFFDPPYLGGPRYAATLEREDVLRVATKWRASGCRVGVSEGEPLPLDGWTAARLAAREFLTMSPA